MDQKQSTDFTCGPQSIRNLLSLGFGGFLRIPSEEAIAVFVETNRDDGTTDQALERWFQTANIPFVPLNSVNQLRNVLRQGGAALLNIDNEMTGHYVVVAGLTGDHKTKLIDPLKDAPEWIPLSDIEVVWRSISTPTDYLGEWNYRWGIGFTQKSQRVRFSDA